MTHSSWKLIFKGVVQGVGFRPTIYRVAHRLGSHGYVLNKGAEVEVVVDIDPDHFMAEVKKDLPKIASIKSIDVSSFDQSFDTFTIRKSEEGQRQSLIPVDTAICPECLNELFDSSNRRFHFPFINCTVCGARFSAITNVPYDRVKTSMDPFPLCSQCQREYEDPFDRRYHAQTISCPRCGPAYQLYDADEIQVKTDHPIADFATLLDSGAIGVVKSWGGMHLCCTLDKISRFRDWYQRPQKAFAVMVNSLETAETYAEFNNQEKELLLDSTRPIVLVKKLIDDSVAPGLDRIGLFLPYTGLHHIIFSFLKKSALIMTSANIPGEPMITQNQDAFSVGADAYLLHNRNIPNRSDDSVIKVWNGHRFFIRKSRGFVPDPLLVDHSSQILSVGAGENVYGALSTDQQLYLTQYIGNARSYTALSFLESSLRHLMNLTMTHPSLDGVAMDLHPTYETKLIAKRFSDEFDVPLFPIQHHWAHGISLLEDNNLKRGIVFALDGLGYGDDGTLWGGEILYCDLDSYHRIGHLQSIPLLGGDKATQDPRRIVFTLYDLFGKEWFFTGKQATLFRQLMKHAPLTSSFARILDAVSCVLGICQERTYDGEPAMKLEPYLAEGKPVYEFDVKMNKKVIETPSLFEQLDEFINEPMKREEIANLAHSFVRSLIEAMVDVAIEYAHNHSIDHIGITGGVSYNIPIVDMFNDILKKHDVSLLVHNSIPNGDGGIAIGQNLIAAEMLSSN